jgi:hypothetical protein
MNNDQFNQFNSLINPMMPEKLTNHEIYNEFLITFQFEKIYKYRGDYYVANENNIFTKFSTKDMKLFFDEFNTNQLGIKMHWKVLFEGAEYIRDDNRGSTFNINKDLLAFKNGVLNLKNNIFKTPNISDKIYLTCNYKYKNKKPKKRHIDQLNAYLASILPDDAERLYVLRHLALALTKNKISSHKTFHFWQNCPPHFIELIELTFGEFVGTLSNKTITKRSYRNSSFYKDIYENQYSRIVIAYCIPKIHAFSLVILADDDPLSSYYTKYKFSNLNLYFMIILLCDLEPTFDSKLEGKAIRFMRYLKFQENINNVEIKPIWRYAFLHLLLETASELKTMNYSFSIPDRILLDTKKLVDENTISSERKKFNYEYVYDNIK